MTEPGALSQEERTWGMACHLAALAGLFTGFGFIVGPLIVWLIKKDQYPFVDDQGKESLNFQISVLIYAAVYTVICFILMLVLIGFLLLWLLSLLPVVNAILIIVAAIAANNGERFRYPLTIRFIH